MTTFRIKHGDTEPRFATTLYANGVIYAIPEDSEVRFLMAGPVRRRDTKVIAAPATIIDGPNGVVEYAPSTDDTDTAGNFVAEWEVTPPDAGPLTFPDTGYDRVVIGWDLG